MSVAALNPPAPPQVSEKVAAAAKAAETLKPVASKMPLTLAEVLPNLKSGKGQFVLTVLGDSTGVGPQAWVRQSLQRIADDTGRPASLRNWNPKTGKYDAPEHVGPAGKETLIVWNGSASGQNASYASQHLVAMLPQKSDLVIINHGHNSPALMNATEHLRGLITAVWRTESERAAIVVTAQNPRLDTGAKIDAEVVKMTKAIPATFPTISVIDAYKAFEDAGNLEALISGDGLHPNPEGQQVWTAAVMDALGF
jgi:lysophospholipase L1-like esterase